jgi:hypothetical protein
VNILKKLYKDFGALGFCSDEGGQDIDKVHIAGGTYQYRCLIHAMRKHPNMLGYMNSNDDVIIQYWKMQSFDLKKIWSESCKRWANIYQPGLIRNTYCNKYQPEDCYSLVDGLGDPLPMGKLALRAAHNSTSKEFRMKMALYTSHENVYCEGDHDFAYIPMQYKNLFLRTVEPFDQSGVSFIYVFGSMLRGIVSDEEIVKPNGLWMWGYDREHWREFFFSPNGQNASLIHSMKLSNKEQREAIINRFQDNQ